MVFCTERLTYSLEITGERVRLVVVKVGLAGQLQQVVH